ERDRPASWPAWSCRRWRGRGRRRRRSTDAIWRSATAGAPLLVARLLDRLGFDGLARPEGTPTPHDDPIALGEAGDDLDAALALEAGLDGSLLEAVPGRDHEHTGGFAYAGNGADRNRQRAVALEELELRLGVHAGDEVGLGIGHVDLGLHRACLAI